ncbi:MAG: DUF4055 domain-containing protein, partial [Planctomycetota bacterium]
MSTASILHPDYTAMLPFWKKIRDVVDGEDAVKARTSDYLPRLDSHKDGTREAKAQYDKYLQRACLHGAAGRTRMGLVGAVMRKEPTIEGVPDDQLRAIKDAAGRDYEPLAQIAQHGLGELATVSRWGLLVDKDRDQESRPYMLPLLAEDVCYWVRGEVNGRLVPVLIALRQSYDVPAVGDVIGNQTESKPEYRLLRLGKVGGVLPNYLQGVPGIEGFAGAPSDEWIYWQEVWRDGTGGLGIVEVVVPTKNGGRFWSEIPCDIVGATGGISLNVEVPVMNALANVVLAHYRNSADLEWGRHMCAIPQPWVAGFQLPEGTTLVVGCGSAWATDNPQAKVGYLEFSGAGLGNIAEGMKEKEQQMAILGARMLEAPKLAAEAMGTVKLRQAGERSVLANIAANCSAAITRAIQRMLAWELPAFDSDEAMSAVVFALDADFDAMPLDPQELASLTAALQAGTISWETFAHNVRRGELLPPGVTDDEERKRIQFGAPGRSRKDELAALQAVFTGGAITHATFLAEVQKLGLLQGVDAEAEVEAIENEAEHAEQRRMEETAARLKEEEARAASEGGGMMGRSWTAGGGFVVGARVRVKAGKAHDAMTKDATGTIKIVQGDTFGVLFDGMTTIHKWYTADE